MNTLSEKGKIIVDANGMEMEFTRAVKRPRMQRIDSSMGTMTFTMAFDGAKAWQINPMSGQSEATLFEGAYAEYFARTSDIDINMLDLAAKGISLDYKGTADVNGQTCHHVLHRFADGHEQNNFFSVETGLMLRTVEMQPSPYGPVAEITMTYSEYGPAGDLVYPYQIHTTAGFTIYTAEISVNEPIEDAFFLMPEPVEEEK